MKFFSLPQKVYFWSSKQSFESNGLHSWHEHGKWFKNRTNFQILSEALAESVSECEFHNGWSNQVAIDPN